MLFLAIFEIKGGAAGPQWWRDEIESESESGDEEEEEDGMIL